MTDKETIPFKAARKLNMLILHNETLLNNKDLQQKIISWGLDMSEEARLMLWISHIKTAIGKLSSIS